MGTIKTFQAPFIDCDFVIGIDTGDKNSYAYLFFRIINGKMEVLKSKVIKDEKEFKQEVENIAKYFNASVLENKH